MKAVERALPVHSGPEPCPTCLVRPGETHELSCPEVSLEQMRAELDRLREERAQWDRRDHLMTLAGRCVLFVAVLLAVALVWGLTR